jgi:hypothetical protein
MFKQTEFKRKRGRITSIPLARTQWKLQGTRKTLQLHGRKYEPEEERRNRRPSLYAEQIKRLPYESLYATAVQATSDCILPKK